MIKKVAREAADRLHDAREEELGVKHPLGGYMLGLVDKKRISGQIEQVKKGERGEHGTIRGRGLKGDFQGDAGALYLWQRKDGSLWLISGRHRYDLLMKDEKMPYHVAYVYVEDDAHNETWARMLDYENNMRDDQADELTAATYVREMKPTDEELYNKGLTRNESRSARGVYIGRQAGQFLWDLFNNGQIKGKRAAENVETICKMTEYIGDAEKKNNVQAMAAKLLAEGESWECINVCIQAMAADKNAPKEGRLKQGNLFFGKDFEAELRQRGRYAARAIAALTAKINAGAGAVKAEANAAAVAEMGFTVTRTQGEEKYTLEELVALRERFRNMAIDTELTQDALEWDGESAIDPIQRYLLDPRARQELEDREARAEELKNMEAEEYLNEHIGSLFGDGASFSIQKEADSVSRTAAEAKQMIGRKGDVMRVSKEEVPENREKLKEYLKNLTNKAFHNAKSNITATITRESSKKIASADNGSALNLMRLGYSEDEAKYIHRAAAVKIGELFEKSELFFEEDVYHKKDDRARVWHFFEPVDVELNGEQETFLSNISVVEYRYAGERIFSLEMTIENPIGDREFTAAPRNGRHSLYPNGVSDVRLAAFDSFVKKEKAQIERNARQQGLIPWRVNEQTVRELEAEKYKNAKKMLRRFKRS